MPAPKNLMTLRPEPPRPRGVDPVIAAGAAGAALFAAGLGGPLWGGLMACVGAMAVYAHWQQQRQLDYQRIQQENLTHFLHGATSPEDLARLKGAADVANKDMYEFLATIKDQYGGESVRGTSRLAGEEQQEAVSPGITLTLAHDLGFWYAKLVLAGDTGRKFLHGEYTQWRARGRTPQEAVEAVIKKAGASRQQKLIQEYAQRMVNDAE